MTLDKAHKLNAMHKNPAKLVSSEVMQDHGQAAVDSLIREYGLVELWDIKPGTKLESAIKS